MCTSRRGRGSDANGFALLDDLGGDGKQTRAALLGHLAQPQVGIEGVEGGGGIGLDVGGEGRAAVLGEDGAETGDEVGAGEGLFALRRA